VARMVHSRPSAVLMPPNSPRRRRRRAKQARYAGVALLAAAVVAAAFFVVGLGRNDTPPARYASASASVPLLGSSVGYESLAQTTEQFGQLPIVRVYYPGLPASNAWTGGQAGANGSAVIVSFKALPKDILSGADDATLTHFFDTAPTGHPIYYSYYHEPEDNIADGEFTLADYKAAWARVAQLAAAARNPDLHSTLILMEWDLQKASGRDWKSYLPGGGIISTLGWDAYSQGSATNVNPQPTPPADFMADCIAASKSVGLPYGFAEFGLSTATGRAAWMTEVGNYLMTSGALFATVFNGTTQYPTLQLTDSASQAVWKGFVAKSVQAQATASAPPPDPVTSASASPTSSAPGGVAPVTSSSWVTGLGLSPAQFAGTGSNHTVISFRIGQQADATILVLAANGTIVRQMDKPAHAAGQITQSYYGYSGNGTRLAPGSYQVLVVASNASGSAAAETTLTISGS
jgi:FlgD Ig-like domain